MLVTRHCFRQRGCERNDHEIELLTELNVPLTCVPSVFTPAAQTAMIKANITPYSTAVGPSSLTKKRLTFETNTFIGHSSSNESIDSCVRTNDVPTRH
jgi:hypothetical protein